jgi:hypothetical protein
VRANTPDNCGQGDRLLDESHCLPVLPSSDQRDITLNIQPCGTGDLTGRDTIAIVQGEELFQAAFSSSTNPLVIALHYHPRRHQGGTTGYKATPFNFNDAYPATPERAQVRIVT